MVIYNKKASEKHKNKATAVAAVLMGRGYNHEMVCQILWYKFGVMATANKNGTIALGGLETFVTIGA